MELSKVNLLRVFTISFTIHLVSSIMLPFFMFNFGDKSIIIALLDQPLEYNLFIDKLSWEIILTLNSFIVSFFVMILFIIIKRCIRSR